MSEGQNLSLDDDAMRAMYTQAKVIAVVGYSRNKDHYSREVAAYLREHGYTIYPVNPNVRRFAWNQRSYASISAIPVQVDVVDVFRPGGEMPSIVADAINAGAKVIWAQIGIINEQAAQQARAAGLDYVMNRCMKVEHMRLFGA